MSEQIVRAGVVGSAMLAVALTSLAGCGGSPSYANVTLAQLNANGLYYDAEHVATSGEVRAAAGHGRTGMVLIDSRRDLVTLEPPRRARRYAGERVGVTGFFEERPRIGGVIEITTIRP
jgi:hypothetical protein